MNAIAKGRNLRVSPLKMRKIIRWLPGKNVMDALAMLKILPNKAAKMAYKVIASAQANFSNKNPEADAKTDRAFSRAEAALRCSKCKGPATRNHESCGTCEGACVGCPGPAAMNAPTSSNACVNQYVHLGPCLKCKKAENNGSGFCASCEPKFAPAEGPKGGR